MMDSPKSAWAEYAETFFNAEELRQRHAFLARMMGQLAMTTNLAVLSQRLCQTAIPELADACFLDLFSESDSPFRIKMACRYPDEAPRFQLESEAQVQAFRSALRAQLSDSETLLSGPDLDSFRRIFSVPLHSGFIVRLGTLEEPLGCIFFAMTRSKREFTSGQMHLIQDLATQGERAILRSRSEEFLKHEVNAREKLISVASHELKTPLTALKLQFDLMKREVSTQGGAFSSEEKMENTFRMIDRTLLRLSQSIGMLFNLSEVQNGQVTLLKEAGDLAVLVRDICFRMDSLMKSSGCQLDISIPERVEGFFDPRRIEQAIVNLLANAAKYAPKSKVEVILTVDDGWAKIWICDQGPGIPKKDHARIFEAFRRIGDQTHVEGLGLGLFVARGVIQAHGGTLSLKSAPEEGAKFLLEFPLWQA